MEESIELAITAQNGSIIDCRLEPVNNDDDTCYSATILYPTTVNGFTRSEIYCHTMGMDTQTGNFLFETGEDPLLPKIRELEKQLSDAIVAARKE